MKWIKSEISLQCRGLTKRFGGVSACTVIDDCALDIHPGELTLLMGPSGSGKSTLLSMLSGLLRPDAGEVVALGQSLWGLNQAQVDAFRLQYCGFVFQGFNLFADLCALDNVALPLRYQGISSRDARSMAMQALEEVGMSGHATQLPAALSGGQKQRVAIARALVKQPRLLFADEPTSALDSENGLQVVALLRSLAHKQDVTVLVVTHDLRLHCFADRVIHLEDGEINHDERTQVVKQAC
ncbi:ABC transporter ATP-binding protein [Chromobacterium sp. Panama]|uniref:ABC transporter ATP-binding protein n=1 Tax=Chromobacterium sp. Panama TaxID=2161826 RepID=UPI000D3274BF|nr:ABC transporter ATP-binding protein [Chromobacterium sp. Panama]PTU63379.1 ABC transporter ATP-binding protein [Chromobacterium sp. Panama]